MGVAPQGPVSRPLAGTCGEGPAGVGPGKTFVKVISKVAGLESYT